jgi:NAD(P)-dependent dehydrogenase (short-subunit alcohol dehydrogenase family)
MAKRIIVVGATGTIGKALVAALQPRFDVVQASHQKAPYKVDLSNTQSIAALLSTIGKVDGIVCAAGDARFAPLAKLSEEDYLYSIRNKLMGQVNLARLGIDYLSDEGHIILTSGILAHKPMLGSAAISMVNAGLEGVVHAAALEMPRGIRINVVSPPWVSETLTAMGEDPRTGKPAAEVSHAYLHILEEAMTGQVLHA